MRKMGKTCYQPCNPYKHAEEGGFKQARHVKTPKRCLLCTEASMTILINTQTGSNVLTLSSAIARDTQLQKGLLRWQPCWISRDVTGSIRTPNLLFKVTPGSLPL